MISFYDRGADPANPHRVPLPKSIPLSDSRFGHWVSQLGINAPDVLFAPPVQRKLTRLIEKGNSQNLRAEVFNPCEDNVHILRGIVYSLCF